MEIIGWILLAAPFLFWGTCAALVIYGLSLPYDEEYERSVREDIRKGRF